MHILQKPSVRRRRVATAWRWVFGAGRWVRSAGRWGCDHDVTVAVQPDPVLQALCVHSDDLIYLPPALVEGECGGVLDALCVRETLISPRPCQSRTVSTFLLLSSDVLTNQPKISVSGLNKKPSAVAKKHARTFAAVSMLSTMAIA